MINKAEMSALLEGPDDTIVRSVSDAVHDWEEADIIRLLDTLEDNFKFATRLPLRLKIYAELVSISDLPLLATISLLRLLRRLGTRKDMPDLENVPEDLPDFTVYIKEKTYDLLGDGIIREAISYLADATGFHRTGDIPGMLEAGERGLKLLAEIPAWENPGIEITLEKMIVAETGHELMFITASASFRTGNTERALEICDEWWRSIEKFEATLGQLDRQRYQYFQLVGQIQAEVGLHEEGLEAYARAIEYAPTRYRMAFIWQSMALSEAELGMMELAWNHSNEAIEAWLDSPYPQAAYPWVEWLASIADTDSKQEKITEFREQCGNAGIQDVNRVTSAMTVLFRLNADLRNRANPITLVEPLDEIIRNLTEAESWPNLYAILATRAVISGRLGNADEMDSSIALAREIIDTRLAPDARPPAQFFIESAYALALRDVGEYEEAFETLFDNALSARMKYPGNIGPEEQTAFQALYYLGALAGYDPETVESKVKSAMSAIS
ncbi:MAG TPA: hypothetical protein VGB30_04055 [bacterium]|jgi:tetratricopeptide (TPR) repeat protein